MAFEELVGILKFHEQKLAQDKRTKKRKSLAIKVQRLKCNSASKEYSFKAFVANDAFEEESDDDDFDDELSLIRFNGSFKRSFHKKEKSLIICYECKKLTLQVRIS